jgi:hypothetical protein
MPFKSEKQRRYLWANEPEIARDWTDTYGSRIQKSKGGITDMVTVPKHWQSAPDHPKTELAYITKKEKDLLVKKDLHNSLKDGPNTGPGGVMSLNGDLADMEAGITGADISAAETGGSPQGMDPGRAAELRAGFIAAGGGGGKPGKDDSPEVKKQFKEIKKASKTRKATQRKKDWFQKNLQKKYKAYLDKYNLTEDQIEELLGYGRDLTYDQFREYLMKQPLVADLDDSLDALYNIEKSKRKKPHSNPLGLLYARTDADTRIELPGMLGQLQGDPTYDNFMTGLNRMAHMKSVLGKDVVSQKDIDNYLSLTMGKGGVDYTGKTVKPLYTPTGGEGGDRGYMGYPSYAAWLAAQNQGGGGGGITTATASTPSAFQQSLNTGVTSSVPYYVGADPTAANLAWGQQFNVDPRTMYRTTFADGGPIRQRYFLGKLVKKIGRAAKKVIKSPVGKMALLGLGAYGLGGAKFLGGQGIFAGGQGLQRFANLKNLKDVAGFKQLLTGGGKDDMYEGKWNPWKLGIAGLTAMPFLMGSGDDKEEDKAFDYDAAKNAYINEIMRIRRDAMAGTLDPSQFVYQGVKDGGRIGGGTPYYDDGKYLGTYTSARDFYEDYPEHKPEDRGRGRKRRGKAQGGSIGYQGGGMEDPMLVDEYKKYVFEMEEMGLQPMSFEEFKQQAIAGMASGGRAGYYAGGQSIPSENTMIDASKTAMQDRLGGITDVMKTADLYRQGDIGQMYMAEGGPTQEAGIMDLGGVEKDYRETGGFVPIGKEEKADDVPARLSLNEFVMTADAVRGMGDGDIDQGAERMEDLMETLEVKGKKNQGAQDMFEVSERLSAVV